MIYIGTEIVVVLTCANSNKVMNVNQDTVPSWGTGARAKFLRTLPTYRALV